MLAEATAAPPLRLPLPHDNCARIIDTWHQAAAQASRPAHSPNAITNQVKPADLVDPVALRTRVARTLATVAHVAAHELQAHTQRREDVDARTPRPDWVMSKGNPPPNHAEAQWIRMLHRHEHHALDQITLATTRRQEPVETEPARAAQQEMEIRGSGPTLPADLATWSIAARRQATDPQSGARDLRRIALTQRAMLYAAAALANAAVNRGEIPIPAGPHLQTRIDTAAQSWAGVADQWTWAQVTRARDATAADVAVSRNLFAAIDTDLRSNRHAWLAPGEVDNRLAGTALVPMLRTILESNEILAEVYQQLPDQLQSEGRLRARATALLQIYKETALDPTEDPSRAPFDLRHLVSDRLRPLTPAAHGRLHSTAADLVEKAERAHHPLLAAAGTNAAATASPATTPASFTVRHHRSERSAPGPQPGPPSTSSRDNAPPR